MMWSVRHNNHIFVFHNGQLVYKNYIPKTSPSILFNRYWPNVQVIDEISSRHRDGQPKSAESK